MKHPCPSETRILRCPWAWRGRDPGDTMQPISDLTIRSPRFLCQSRSCSISSQAPDILRFVMTEHVTVTVVHEHAKVSCPGRAPAILHRHDFPRSVPQIQSQGTLVRLKSGIAIHTDNLLTHGLAPLFGYPPTPRSRRRPGKQLRRKAASR